MSDKLDTENKGRSPMKSVPPISKDVLDVLLEQYGGPSGLTGPDGLLKQLTKALIERAMEAEITEHLGYAEREAPPPEQSNRRNGKGKKTLRTEHGPLEVEVPRDRQGSFEPQIVPKHQREFGGFDDKILSMYGRGMSTREIRAHLEELYGVEVSPDLVSRVTDAVLDELKAWQQRPLEPTYLVVYVDAMVVKIRDKGVVTNKSAYTVVGVRADGHKDILGLWLQTSEGAKFWLAIFHELRQRGVQDILILCADGLTGLPDAVEAAFPRTIFQTCIVHMIRSSTRFVPWKERKAVCADLRGVYTATHEQDALRALEHFEATWGERYPMIGKAWQQRWAEISPFLAFPQEIRRAIYTTNAIEALHRRARKVVKTRGAFPTDDAALKLLFLAYRNSYKTWGKPHITWGKALLQFAIFFENRIPQ